jgi:hypothetical protein
MCMPKPPKIDQATKDAQKAAREAEQNRRRDLKEQQLKVTKRGQEGSGIRSLISGSSGSGFGRNFF